MTAIFSARPITTSIRCSTISTVFPSSRCTDRISSTSSSTSSAETPAMGSSRRITSGRLASSIASSSFRLSPCESSPAGQSVRAPRPTRTSASAARSRASATDAARRQIRSEPPRWASAARRTFSCTDRSGKTLDTWNVRPSPERARRYGASAVTSRPCSSTPPAVGRTSPESRLKSVVLPAPFGPMMPTSSPARTSSETSTTILAPPMSSPRFRVARIGAEVATIPEVRESPLARLRRGDELPLDPGDDPRLPLPVRSLDQLHLEHRLNHRVVGRADVLLALRSDEAPALERGANLVDVVALRAAQRPHDHLAGDEAVRGEQVGHLAALPHRVYEKVVDPVLGRGGDVVREEVDLGGHVAEGRPRPTLGETGRDLVRDAERTLLLECAPHRRRRRARPGDEEQVRVGLLHLLGERGEVLRRERHEQPPDVVALRADDRVDRRVVADAEGRVLREHG